MAKKNATETKKATSAKKATAKATKSTKGKPAAKAEPVSTGDPDELVVFAMRVTRGERDLIHAAAGSGKASKFVRSIAVAAAKGDDDLMKLAMDLVKKAE